MIRPNPRARTRRLAPILVVAVVLAVIPFVGAAPAPGHFVLSGQGTVHDRITGLGWQHAGPAETMTYAEASTYCAQLGLAGSGNFRLPTVEELATIVDDTRIDPAIDTDSFGGTFNARYWTSTPGASGNHWRIHFGLGDMYDESDSSEFYVRCVH